MNAGICCECKQPIGRQSALLCADCGQLFHFPDARVNEQGVACGTHVVGFRELLGRDVVALCRRCDMAFRLRFGVPS